MNLFRDYHIYLTYVGYYVAFLTSAYKITSNSFCCWMWCNRENTIYFLNKYCLYIFLNVLGNYKLCPYPAKSFRIPQLGPLSLLLANIFSTYRCVCIMMSFVYKCVCVCNLQNFPIMPCVELHTHCLSTAPIRVPYSASVVHSRCVHFYCTVVWLSCCR